jgi:ketosteroid isomerase-like protein
MEILELAKRFIDCLGEGDVEGARNCFHEDAEIWHDFDGKTQTREENLATLVFMMSRTKKREYEILRLEEIQGGYLQRHTLHVTSHSDETYSAEALVIVTVKDDKIARIEEFLNPAPLLPALRAA